MSQWNANANAQPLTPGTRVVISSPHRVVRVVTADQLAIDTPDRSRLTAVVAQRDGPLLTLSLPDGTPVRLTIMADNSLSPPPAPALPFSQQEWVVN
jgi:hypothetical protein